MFQKNLLVCLVLESPVQSGFLTPKGSDRDQDRSAFVLELKKTRLDRKKTEDRSLLQSLDQSWSRLVITSSRPVFWPKTEINSQL
jgi:hypothetical protein